MARSQGGGPRCQIQHIGANMLSNLNLVISGHTPGIDILQNPPSNAKSDGTPQCLVLALEYHVDFVIPFIQATAALFTSLVLLLHVPAKS